MNRHQFVRAVYTIASSMLLGALVTVVGKYLAWSTDKVIIMATIIAIAAVLILREPYHDGDE